MFLCMYVFTYVCTNVYDYAQASLHRLNWMANPDTENGLLHSAGLMVNYLYAIPADTTTAATSDITSSAVVTALLPSSLQKLKNDENIRFLQSVDISARAQLIKEKNIYEVPLGSQIQDILKP